MQTHQIWMEGFHIAGRDRVGASFVGSAEGNSFREAVLKWYRDHPNSSFHPTHLTNWGCGHYPTEAEARKSFG